VEKLSEKAQEYELMLKELGTVVEARAADRIRSLLDKVGLFLPALQSMISVANIIEHSMFRMESRLPIIPSHNQQRLRMRLLLKMMNPLRLHRLDLLKRLIE
jgi:hypothetical protein